MLCFVGGYQFAVETTTIERIADRSGIDPGRIIELSALLGDCSDEGQRILIVNTVTGRHGFAVESISKGDLSSLPIQPVPPCVSEHMTPMILKGFVNVEDLLLEVIDLAKLAEWIQQTSVDPKPGRTPP